MHGDGFARTPKKQKWILAVIRSNKADLPFELSMTSASIYSQNPYTAGTSSWYAVRAYYAGGPWCAVGGTSGYGMAGGLWGGSWTCYSGWADYAQRNGIGCTPGTLV